MENEVKKEKKKIVYPEIKHTDMTSRSYFVDKDGHEYDIEENVKVPVLEEKRSWESEIIELAIYYSISKEDYYLGLRGCACILKNEIDIAEKGETIFYINGEHIVDKLAEKFKDMDKYKYIDILKKAIRRIEYFCTYNTRNYLLEIDSEQCIEELSDLVVNYSKSLEELEKSIEKLEVFLPGVVLPSTMYEIGCKYIDSNEGVMGYKYINEAAKNGHIRAAYQKILCLYYGSNEYKNEYQAFYEANELLKDKKYSSIYNKLYELIGEMYYEGKGVKQDYSKALEYFKKTEKDLSASKYYLGLMYIDGYGVEIDKALGINYILKSARDGNKKAIDYIIDYIFKKDVSPRDVNSNIGLDDLFDFEDIVESKEKKKPSNEYQELREKFKEKFGEYPYSLEPEMPIDEEIAAIKECLEKGENIIMDIYKRKDHYSNKNDLY